MSTGDENATAAEELTRPTWHRFVSPHYDDIALSCGGTAALLARAGRAPEVAIVFGDEPDPTVPLTPYAAAMHRGWGLDAAGVIAARRREEAAAAAALGTTVRTLPFLDAIYRGGHYGSDDALFGPTAPAEALLPDWIVSALVLDTPPEPGVRVYAPLAIGGHVDHRHVFAAGLTLARTGWDVWFYEDLPYAIRTGALEERLAETAAAGNEMEVTATVEVGATWAAKLAAILAYPSQLATVFRYVHAGAGRDEIDAAMRGYTARHGGMGPTERFWRVQGVSVSESPSF